MWFYKLLCHVALIVLCTVSLSYPDDQRWSPSPSDEHWEGSRTWKPDRYRRQELPDHFIIDKPGKCQVVCEWRGREYKCREYRC